MTTERAAWRSSPRAPQSKSTLLLNVPPMHEIARGQTKERGDGGLVSTLGPNPRKRPESVVLMSCA
ncbi:MAG: hypothetical protein Q9218_004106 [Villophora microphyllina]